MLYSLACWSVVGILALSYTSSWSIWGVADLFPKLLMYCRDSWVIPEVADASLRLLISFRSHWSHQPSGRRVVHTPISVPHLRFAQHPPGEGFNPYPSPLTRKSSAARSHTLFLALRLLSCLLLLFRCKSLGNRFWIDSRPQSSLKVDPKSTKLYYLGSMSPWMRRVRLWARWSVFGMVFACAEASNISKNYVWYVLRSVLLFSPTVPSILDRLSNGFWSYMNGFGCSFCETNYSDVGHRRMVSDWRWSREKFRWASKTNTLRHRRWGLCTPINNEFEKEVETGLACTAHC